MLIYEKTIEEQRKLFGTMSNIPSENDLPLVYTNGENEILEEAPSLNETYLDNGKGGIIVKSTGEELKVFIDKTNIIPGDDSEPVPPTPAGNFYLTFSSAESFSISTTNASKSWDGTLEYSTDTENWTEWDGTEVNSSEDGKLYFRGSNNSVIAYYNSWALIGNAISCIGNIETLLDYQTVMNGEHPQMGGDCYNSMFQNCTSLTTAPELPAITLAEGCYASMFSGCTSLTATPELPATTLANSCYGWMFENCTSLTTAPELPATTLANYCYGSMFNGCTSLTTAPQLPATTLAVICYSGMFIECTSLTTAPELPATTLTDGCYSGMFVGCASLTTTPELPATTLTEGCYTNMFKDCTSLTTAPELPAITLTNNCYDSMFYGCTSLATLPQLPAITLVRECYAMMFSGCTSIKLSATQDADYTTPYRIPKEGEGTNASSAMLYMFAKTGGTFTGNPAINTTYYLHKDNHIV